MTTPTNLEEAHTALRAMLTQSQHDHLLKSDAPAESLAIELHHSLGRHLRNEWGLWQGSELAKDLRGNHGISHPDDMSHFIIVTYCQRFIRTRFERIG